MFKLLTMLLVQTDAAFAAYKAANEAVAEGKYERAAALLDEMAAKGSTWVSEAGQKKAALVRRLAKSLDDVTFRIEFADVYWIQNVPALGQHHEPARQLLVETLKLKPNEEQKQEIYRVVLRYSLALDDVKTAEEYLHLLLRVVGHGKGDEPLMEVARHQLEKQRYKEARDLLLSLLRGEKPPAVNAKARLALADAYAGLKDEASFVGQLEEVAKHAAQGPFDFPRETALLRLAKHYQSKGDYTKAYDHFTRYTPNSDCKTCLISMHESRQQSRLECLLRLKHFGESVNLCIESLEPERSYGMATALFRLYREADQMEDLLKRVQATPKLRDHAAVKGLVRLQELAAKKDIKALIGICQDSSWVSTNVVTENWSDWRCRAAAEALASCMGKDFADVRTAIQAHQKNISWLIYALGRTPSAEARELLEELARKERNQESDNVEYALTLQKGGGVPRPKVGSLPRP